MIRAIVLAAGESKRMNPFPGLKPGVFPGSILSSAYYPDLKIGFPRRERMKTQKLLLPFGEATMIEAVVRAALDSSVDGVLVVLGSDGDEIREKLGAYPVTFVVNENFRRGMLSSIQAGFEALPEKARAAVLMLGDQPAVTAEVNDEIIARYRETRRGIVIPTHGGRRGHPVVIDTKYKKEIALLSPEAGLRRLRLDHPDDVLEVELPFPAILKDVDTPEDYHA